MTLEGDANGAPHPEPSAYANKFSGGYSHRTIDGGIGHNLPQETPEAFAQAVVDVDRYLSSHAGDPRRRATRQKPVRPKGSTGEK
jgi:hypothetical protein